MFKELNKSISNFLWKGKAPRVKYTYLQASCANGGLNLPNFRLYYLAAQFRSVWCWLHSEDHEIRWLSIEQHLLRGVPLRVLPFLPCKKALLNFTKDPIILSSYCLARSSCCYWFKHHIAPENSPLG